MKKRQKNLKLKILFNASVVLSGINSPKGGSAVLLNFVKIRKLNGIISETILDEILRHSAKFGLTRGEMSKFCLEIFPETASAPSEREVKKYYKTVIDEGDAHILASCEREKVDFLVTLDKKHLLILKGRIKDLKIMTPGELIKYIFEV